MRNRPTRNNGVWGTRKSGGRMPAGSPSRLPSASSGQAGQAGATKKEKQIPRAAALGMTTSKTVAGGDKYSKSRNLIAQLEAKTRLIGREKAAKRGWRRRMRRRSKIQMGLIETLRLLLRNRYGYSCAARGCDAPGSRKSKTKEAILDGRKKHH